ncbi:MAG: orotate phosphoribosyltransferase [Geminicoccaceae bacterium]|nr:MAG: orotate phosphoribosyltransferase [Geminicoccaceae bacterium]
MVENAARTTARMLLEVDAVSFRPDPPYRFTSGWASPVYIDCRRLISYPRLRRQLMKVAAAQVQETIGYEAFDAVAGGETAGIPFAAWLADQLMLPMLYARKQPKGFGRNARIEGNLREGQRVLLVEDLATDGVSKLAFADALREAGAVVEHVFVVFYFGVFPHSLATLSNAGLRLHTLATWHDLLAEARLQAVFAPEILDEIEGFLNDPIRWSAAHGGKG